MSSIVYNIPLSLAAVYRGEQIIVRFQDSSRLVATFREADLENLLYVQLLSLTADLDTLANWGCGVPVDVVMRNPESEFSTLYRHAKLLDKHPIRVSIPVMPGFSKAVKLAASLRFAVKLEVGQPDPGLIDEMSSVLDFFLHHSSVSQPVEYFQSSLLAFYNHQATTLWSIQEEDPARIRYITDDGEEIVSPRLRGAKVTGRIDSFVYDFKSSLIASASECCGCEFLENCGGYFKWPRGEYSCDGVKSIFRTLKGAAAELKNDLSAFAQLRETGEAERRVE